MPVASPFISGSGKTAYGQHKIARSKNEILAVQTLRNWQMSATFPAIPVEDTKDLIFLNKSNDKSRASVFSFSGLRCLYLSVPLVLWILGPAWLLIVVLFPLDWAPRSNRNLKLALEENLRQHSAYVHYQRP